MKKIIRFSLHSKLSPIGIWTQNSETFPTHYSEMIFFMRSSKFRCRWLATLDTMSIKGIIVSTLHILYRKGNKGVCVYMCVCVCIIFYHHPLDSVVTVTSISWEKVLWKTAETFVEMLGEISVSQSGLSLELYPKIPQHLKITTLSLLCCCGFE